MKIINKPWGKEKIIFKDGNIQCKLLYIKKGEETSLQYHNYKVETIIPLDNNSLIEYAGEHLPILTLEETKKSFRISMKRGEHRTISPREIHRFIAKKDTVIIELSFGYDKDIVRIEDKYNRSK